MSTPHIEANKNQIAKIVLMCGDPLRAEFFTKKYLKNYELVNSVRGMLTFTGTLNGKWVTVMGHGMGLDSIGIYAYELYKFYDVEKIIRFGSCGSYNPNHKLFDVFVASKSFSESNYGEAFGNNENVADASQNLVDVAKKALNSEERTFFGTVNSSMWFYQTENIKEPKFYMEKGVEVVEMESYALYSIASALNKEALTILSVSDSIVNNEFTSSEERRSKFTKMFESLIKIVKEL